MSCKTITNKIRYQIVNGTAYQGGIVGCGGVYTMVSGGCVMGSDGSDVETRADMPTGSN